MEPASRSIAWKIGFWPHSMDHRCVVDAMTGAKMGLEHDRWPWSEGFDTKAMNVSAYVVAFASLSDDGTSRICKPAKRSSRSRQPDFIECGSQVLDTQVRVHLVGYTRR